MVNKGIKLDLSLTKTYNDVSGLSMQSLFYTMFGEFPSCYLTTNERSSSDYRFDTEKIFNGISEFCNNGQHDMEYIKYTEGNMDTKKETPSYCIFIKDLKICARVEQDIDESYLLYSENDSESLKSIIDILISGYYKPKAEECNIWKIGATNSGYTLLKSKVSDCPDFDVTKQYNDDFACEDEKISNFINEDNKSGLVILHGEKGTGKTTYIRNLIKTHMDKKFVYVPSNLVQMLGDPSFNNFIGTIKNSIIILEDCEGAIQTRKSGNASAVSLILNMTDGLLSDDLCTKFVCTFNDDTKNIDSALLRKGRLVSKYEFKPLCADKTDALLAELHIFEEGEELPHKAMTLADIYNYGDKAYTNERKSII